MFLSRLGKSIGVFPYLPISLDDPSQLQLAAISISQKKKVYAEEMIN